MIRICKQLLNVRCDISVRTHTYADHPDRCMLVIESRDCINAIGVARNNHVRKINRNLIIQQANCRILFIRNLHSV